MARRRTPAAEAPAPEPVAEAAEETTHRRGPSALSMAHAAWIKAEYGIDADPEVVYLAQTTRKEFRGTEAYEAAVEAMEAEKEKREQEREERKKARETAKAAREAEAEAEEAEETPKPRRRRAAQTTEAPAAEEAPAPAKRTRARKAAATPAAEEPAVAAPAKRNRKAPF